MTWRDTFFLAVSGLRGGFVRTMLTILGLAIGVAAVLTVLTLGAAGEDRVEAEIAKLGVDKVWIRANDQTHALQAHDAQNLYRATSAPACAGAYTLSRVLSEEAVIMAQVAGFDQAMQTVHAPKILKGRNFIARDFLENSAVCLVDESLADALGDDITGRRVVVNQRVFRIVGVMKSMAAQNMSAASGVLVMPIGTYMDTFGGNIAEITLAVQRGQSAQWVADEALKALSAGSGFRADTLEEEINAAREVVRIFVTVLTCVAVVCMLTGSIGVMNVLLVSVRERRQEIGLIKAVGASSAQVAGLFLAEACLYALFGGCFGIGLGILMIQTFGRWIGLKTALSIETAIPVLLAATAMGIFFGVVPAMKAARLQPVEALQCE